MVKAKISYLKSMGRGESYVIQYKMLLNTITEDLMLMKSEKLDRTFMGVDMFDIISPEKHRIPNGVARKGNMGRVCWPPKQSRQIVVVLMHV